MIVASDITTLFGLADINIDIDTSDLVEDEPLRTYGLDSMDISLLILQVERQYGLSLSPEQTVGLRSLKDFVRLVNGATGH
jgi:acyl carrier protein